MSGALVSAIVPTHGRADFLARALESIVRQNWPAIEIIVVDDNGRGTPRQLATAALVDGLDGPDGGRTVRYLANERNRGGGFTRNVGVAAATGEYLAFLDDDDEWCPAFLERGVRTLLERPADVVYCDCIVVDDGDRARGKREVNVKHEGDVRAALIDGWCPSSTSLFVLRRSAVVARNGLERGVSGGDPSGRDTLGGDPAERGPFDPRLASFQDYDCWLGLSAHARFGFHDEALVIKHRHRSGQITSDTTARRAALTVLENKWMARLDEAERVRFRGALDALEHDILRMSCRNAVHARHWRRAAGYGWRYVTGRGSIPRNAVALLRSTLG